MRLRASTGQEPEDVARACVRVASRTMGEPAAATLTRAVLRRWAPGGQPGSGDWVPRALLEWAQSVPRYREPAGPGYAGEIVQSLPLTVLQGGDCDDIATAVVTMARVLGLPAAIGLLHRGRSSAHVTAAVGSGWHEHGLAWVVDPELAQLVPVAQLVGIRWFPVA